MGKFVIQSAAVRMPSSVKAPYRRIAVLELEEGFEGVPTMISSHARGVKRVVRTWEGLFHGLTRKCA